MNPPKEYLHRPPRSNLAWIREQLRDETVGGLLLIISAAIALIWANSPWGDAYANIATYRIGPADLGLDLPLAVWASDGLLAVFFFVVGLELKYEFVLGSLSKFNEAIMPAAAALGGMAVPALIFFGVNHTFPDGSVRGWGIPMATDIAFALAVLAVVGRSLPVALRVFLLTLAVVDDFGGIVVIAVFYTETLSFIWLAGAVVTFVLYAIGMRLRITTSWFYIPVVLIGWYCMHESGIHATIAGVVFGLLTRVRPEANEESTPATRLSHRLHPFSAAFCVPIFAFFAAGIDLRSIGLWEALKTPIALGVILGLVLGKPIGIFTTVWLMSRFTRAKLSAGVVWRDVLAIGVLGGIGFTVALLIAELAYLGQEESLDSGKVAVLAASILAALLSAILLRSRNRHYARVGETENADLNEIGP